MNLKFLKKSDLILVAVIVLLCAAFLVPKYLGVKSNLTAVIYKDGEIVEQINLSSVTESYEIDLECMPEAKLTVEPGCIYYSYADCPDKLCVNTGRLSRAGDTAACIPSKTLVVLVGDKEANSPDVITY